jgi:hypothetical protein
LRPAQKYLTKQRNWDTQFTVYWVNKRKQGEKKSSCRSFFYADKTRIYKFLALTGKETTFPEIPSGLMQGYPWTWDAPHHLRFTVIQDNWQNKNVHYRIHTVAHLCLGSAHLSPSGKWLTNTSELNWRVIGGHKLYLIRSTWQQILRPCTTR